MLYVHIACGAAALVAGFIALFSRKGGRTHRRFGRWFVYAMVVMTVSAALIAGVMRPNPGNAAIALTMLYLVLTGWASTRPSLFLSRRWTLAGSVFGAASGSYACMVAAEILATPSGIVKDIPGAPLLVFGVLTLLGTLGDVRHAWKPIASAPSRVFRHVWRTAFPLVVAAGSFFQGQADEFPRAVQASGVLMVPVLVVLLTFLYYLVKQAWGLVRGPRHRRANVASAPQAAAEHV